MKTNTTKAQNITTKWPLNCTISQGDGTAVTWIGDFPQPNIYPYTTPQVPYTSPYSPITIPGTTDRLTTIFDNNFKLTTMSKIQQHKVAVFKLTRNEENEITSTEFLKEMWVETQNGSSVEFEVARDKDLSKYKSTDILIHKLHTISF